MDFSKLLEWIKLSPKYLFAISVVCGSLLFSPANWINSLGLENFITAVRPWLGMVFLLSTTLFIIGIAIDAWKWGKKYYENQKLTKYRIKRLHELTAEEKEILLGYILHQSKTQYLGYADGVVNGLEIEKIIFRSSNIGDPDRWAFNIQPWAWEI